MQPAEDFYIIRNTDPLTLDRSQPLKDGEKVKPTAQVSSKVGIDATKKFLFPPLAVPPKEHLEKVDAEWQNTALKKSCAVRNRQPWLKRNIRGRHLTFMPISVPRTTSSVCRRLTTESIT